MRATIIYLGFGEGRFPPIGGKHKGGLSIFDRGKPLYKPAYIKLQISRLKRTKPHSTTNNPKAYEEVTAVGIGAAAIRRTTIVSISVPIAVA